MEDKNVTVLNFQLPTWFVTKFVFAILFAIQLCKVVILIPFPSLFFDVPLTQGNYTQVYADVLRDRQLREATGRGWGYDPSQMAGYPAGTILEVDSRPAILFDRLLRSWLSAAQTIRLSSFLSLLSIPLFLYWACLGFGLRNKTALTAMALSVAGFANYEAGSRQAIYLGQVFLVVSGYIAVFSLARLMRFLSKPTILRLSIYSFSLFLLLLFQPSVFALTLIPMLIVTLAGDHKLKTKGLALAGLLLGIIGNIFWLAPFMQYRNLIFMKSLGPAKIPKVLSGFFTEFFTTMEIAHLFLRLAMVIGFVMGIRILLKANRPVAKVFLIWLGVIIAGIWLGAYWPTLAPNSIYRYLPLMGVALIIPASVFMSQYFLQQHRPRILFFFWVIWVQMVSPMFNPQWHKPIAFDVDNQTSSIIDFLKKLPRKGRILIETEPTTSPSFGLYPFLTRHEYLGLFTSDISIWPYVSTNFRSKTKVMPALLFGKPLTKYSKEELSRALNLYNVTYIGALSLQARSRLDRHPDLFRPLSSTSQYLDFSAHPPKVWPRPRTYRLYKVLNYSPSYFITGSGKLMASTGKIQIENPSQSELVIKYHWIESLKVTEGVQIYPVPNGTNSMPFIGLSNPKGLNQILIYSE